MALKKILVPVDGSDHSLDAVHHAVDVAGLAGAEVILMTCHKPVPSSLGEPNFQEVLDRLVAEADLILAQAQEPLQGTGLAVTTKTIAGDTAKLIVEVAEVEGVDLVVMGNRGLGGFSGLLLGSVTHKVLQSAPCPVTVVR